MPDDELDLSDRDIAEAEREITRQFALLERLSALGQDMTAAKERLREMEHHLDILHELRRALLGPRHGAQ